MLPLSLLGAAIAIVGGVNAADWPARKTDLAASSERRGANTTPRASTGAPGRNDASVGRDAPAWAGPREV